MILPVGKNMSARSVGTGCTTTVRGFQPCSAIPASVNTGERVATGSRVTKRGCQSVSDDDAPVRVDRMEWTEYECKCGFSWKEYGQANEYSDAHDERGELRCSQCNRTVGPKASVSGGES